MRLTGKTLNGDYAKAPRRSGKKYDEPTSTIVMITIDGQQYQRTVHERKVWRNSKPSKVVAQFVKVNGINYEVEV